MFLFGQENLSLTLAWKYKLQKSKIGSGMIHDSMAATLRLNWVGLF